jgi:PatG Domain
MENTETTQPSAEQPIVESPNLSPTPRTIYAANHIHPSQGGDESCPTCSAAKNTGPVQYVYAVGRIRTEFGCAGDKHEYAAIQSRTDTKGLTDSKVFQKVISENRYLARKLRWILSIQGLETYFLQPMDQADLDLLIGSLSLSPSLNNLNIVIGVLGPIAPPQYCNGLQIPIVGVHQIYSFDVPYFIKSIPLPDKITAKEFTPVAEELFMRFIELTTNEGIRENRIINYLLFRYALFYITAFECYRRDFSLAGVEVKGSELRVNRDIKKVIVTYKSRTSDATEKYFCTVDGTDIFPYVVKAMGPHIDLET